MGDNNMNIYSYNYQWEAENQDITQDDSGIDDAAQRMADNWGITVEEAYNLIKEEEVK